MFTHMAFLHVHLRSSLRLALHLLPPLPLAPIIPDSWAFASMNRGRSFYRSCFSLKRPFQSIHHMQIKGLFILIEVLSLVPLVFLLRLRSRPLQRLRYYSLLWLVLKEFVFGMRLVWNELFGLKTVVFFLLFSEGDSFMSGLNWRLLQSSLFGLGQIWIVPLQLGRLSGLRGLGSDRFQGVFD